jgi:hypothetical protein
MTLKLPQLAVVMADVEVEDKYLFERRWYGSNPEQLRLQVGWLIEQQVEEVVFVAPLILAGRVVARKPRKVRRFLQALQLSGRRGFHPLVNLLHHPQLK